MRNETCNEGSFLAERRLFWEFGNLRTSGALDGHNPRANVNLHCKRDLVSVSRSSQINVASVKARKISPSSCLRKALSRSSFHTSSKHCCCRCRIAVPPSCLLVPHPSPCSWSNPCSPTRATGKCKTRDNRILTIVGDGQPFLGVNVPHLDCVGCGMSEGRIVDVVVRSVVERIEIRRGKPEAFFGGAKMGGLCVA